MSSPSSHTKITSMASLGDIPKPPGTSRSKSKFRKKQSKGRGQEKSKEKVEKVKSEQEYGFSGRNNVYLTRTSKAEKEREREKRSLKSSERSSQVRKSGDGRQPEARFVRQHRSPNAIPRPVK